LSRRSHDRAVDAARRECDRPVEFIRVIGNVAKRWRGVEAANDRIGSRKALPVSLSLDTNAIVSTATAETAAGRLPLVVGRREH
jgi:hypothetical protein